MDKIYLMAIIGGGILALRMVVINYFSGTKGAQYKPGYNIGYSFGYADGYRAAQEEEEEDEDE